MTRARARLFRPRDRGRACPPRCRSRDAGTSGPVWRTGVCLWRLTARSGGRERQAGARLGQPRLDRLLSDDGDSDPAGRDFTVADLRPGLCRHCDRQRDDGAAALGRRYPSASGSRSMVRRDRSTPWSASRAMCRSTNSPSGPGRRRGCRIRSPDGRVVILAASTRPLRSCCGRSRP